MLDGVRLVERLTDPNTAGDLPFGFLKYERLYREQIERCPRPGPTGRCIPDRVKHDPAAQGLGLEPALRGPSRPGRLHHPQLSRTRNPANHLTRGIATNQFPPPAKQMILFNGSCSRS